MKKVIISAIAVAAIASQTAYAAPKTEGAYVFGNYTHANLKSNAERFDENQSKNALGFGGGYRFNENFALELGYKSLGKAHAESYEEDTINGDIDDKKINYKAQALAIRAIGIMPITNEFALEGFVGAAIAHQKFDYRWDYTDTYTGKHTTEEAASFSKTALAASIGVGATYALNDNLSVFTRYEYTALPKIDELKLKSHTIDLGLRYHF